jgi:hypothetical protein
MRVDLVRYLHNVEKNIKDPEPPKLHAVILFPKMRQQVGVYPRNVRVYEEGVDMWIKQLCKEQKVPLYEIKNWKRDEGVQPVAKLLE